MAVVLDCPSSPNAFFNSFDNYNAYSTGTCLGTEPACLYVSMCCIVLWEAAKDTENVTRWWLAFDSSVGWTSFDYQHPQRQKQSRHRHLGTQSVFNTLVLIFVQIRTSDKNKDASHFGVFDESVLNINSNYLMTEAFKYITLKCHL